MEKDIIIQAKASLGDKAAEIIAQGINLQKWDNRNLKGCCPFHNEKTPSFSWNPKTNNFKCFGCGKTMDILDYYMLTMTFHEAVKELCFQTGTPYENEYKPFNKKYKYPKAEKEIKAIKEYLHTRCISDSTIAFAGVKEDDKNNIAFEYKDQYGTLLLVKYRPARRIGKGENKCWCQKDSDTIPLLYGMDKVDTTKPLLICEGEIDRLSAIESGFNNVVSVPFGAGNYGWIEQCFDWLEQFNKIILWSDADEAGRKMIKEVVPRLREERCFIVNPSQYLQIEKDGKTIKIKDINEILFCHGKDTVYKLICEAEEVPIAGIIDLADVEDLDLNSIPKIESGINGLDKWIGGFYMGTVDVITGINGSGKSTFVNQVCVCEPLNQGYKTFIFSGELTKEMLRNWLEFPIAGDAVKANEPIENRPTTYYVPKLIKEKMRRWYKGKVFIYDDNNFTAKAILSKMEIMARKYEVKNFVLDNLLMIDLECSEYERNQAQTNFTNALVNFAKKYKVVVHLVVHPKKTEGIQRLTKMDISGSGNITNLPHYVISVHRVTPKEKEDIKNKAGVVIESGCKYDCLIELFKNRLMGYQDKVCGVFYDYPSKRFYQKTSDLLKKYKWVDEGTQIDVNGFHECDETLIEEFK